MPTRTEILLTAVDDGGDGTRTNTVTVRDGAASLESEVTIEGEPFLVSLSPPSQPLLVISECQVTDVRETDFSAIVSWESPANALFSAFEISVGGVVQAIVDRVDRSYEFNVVGADPRTVRVSGIGLAGTAIAAVTCEVAGVFRPTVVCVNDATASPQRNLVSWETRGRVDGFSVYRNGRLMSTQPPNVRRIIDSEPTVNGGDVYEVSGFIETGSEIQNGARGICDDGIVGDPNPNETRNATGLSLSLLPRRTPPAPNVLSLRWVNGEAYETTLVKLFLDGGTVPVASEVFDSPTVRWDYGIDGGGRDGGLDGGGEGLDGGAGVSPGRYRFSVVGLNGAVESQEIFSANLLEVRVPPLTVDLTCESLSGTNARLTWDAPWPGYTSFDLSTEINGVAQGEPQPMRLEATDLVIENLPPDGDFRFTLRAGFEPRENWP